MPKYNNAENTISTCIEIASRRQIFTFFSFFNQIGKKSHIGKEKLCKVSPWFRLPQIV